MSENKNPIDAVTEYLHENIGHTLAEKVAEIYAKAEEEHPKPEKYVQLNGTDCLNCKHSCQLEHQPVIGACGDKYPINREFCESCHCYFDIDTMRSDEDANWFCKKCWGEMV